MINNKYKSKQKKSEENKYKGTKWNERLKERKK
jgi:hypothetical protein